ncbi:UvrD-helicase domain-containing protein [Chloroflexota bacterium]
MNGKFDPSDQASRDRIETDLNTTCFVEAGAGTGKTRELVCRIINLIACGMGEINHIAAITFTEAAAAELRDRVRNELEKHAADQALEEEKRARCQAALSRFDDASIQTLHSFAASLLRERPFEAGLPPNFEVTAEMEASIEFEKNWQEWVDSAMEKEEISSHLFTAMNLGLRLDDLRTVARSLHDNYDRLSDRFEAVSPPLRRAAGLVMGEMNRIRELQSLASKGLDDPLAAHAHRVAELADILGSMDCSSNAALSLLAGFGKLSCRLGSQKDWANMKTGENGCKILKDLLAELEETKCEELEAVRRAALIPLLEDIRYSLLTWVEHRRNTGKVNFHDLLVRTRDMLREMPEVREHFQEHFTYILIDEFQDTDPIQAEIAFFLSADRSAMGDSALKEKDWRKLIVAPGKLFVVGDPKQSIYRFRRADIATVQEVGELLGTDKVPLEQNFRSQQPVIDWVNAIFSKWMGNGKPRIQAAYSSLSWRWNNEEAVPPMGVHHFGLAVDEPASQIKKYEAISIAGAISRIKTGQWLVRDENNNSLRPARYCDICILMPTRTILPYVERALDEAQIPYRVESESFILGTQDVRELLSCLRAIDSPADRVALVAALRSTAFSCSDVELVEFLDKGGCLDYTSPVKANGSVTEALEVLARYNQMRLWAPIDQLIEKFIRERRLAELSFGRARPRERLRRLKLVTDQARAFSQVGERSLRVFVDWMEQQMAEGSRMVEIPVPEADEDAVRIMTIHAAKGLEFPIVVLAGIGSSGTSRSSQVIFDRGGVGVHVSLGAEGKKFITLEYEAACEREKEADEEELVRLMYVATTRAKDHLVISLYRKATRSESKVLNAVIERFAMEANCVWHEIDCASIDLTETLQARSDSKDTPETSENRESWIAHHAKVIKQASSKPAIAVTKLAHSDKDEAEWGEVHYRKGRGGTSLGRAVHSVLQSIDLATGEGLEEISQAQATAEGIPHLCNDVAMMVSNALRTLAVRRAIASGKYYRELFVSLPLEMILVEGFIDLLFEEDDGIVIVDYKTDMLDEKTEEERMGQYKLQAAAYALVVSEITNKPVKEVVLVFVRTEKELILKNLRDLYDTVRERSIISR